MLLDTRDKSLSFTEIDAKTQKKLRWSPSIRMFNNKTQYRQFYEKTKPIYFSDLIGFQRAQVVHFFRN